MGQNRIWEKVVAFSAAVDAEEQWREVMEMSVGCGGRRGCSCEGPKTDFEGLYIVRVDTMFALILRGNDKVRAVVREPSVFVIRI